VRTVNVIDCELGDVLQRGEFRFDAFDLTDPLGGRVIGATVYEVQDGDRLWPYHYHYGVEEWLYVVSGAPILRDPGGERTLEPGVLAAFPSGPLGGHAVRGPGRIVIFSAGARGFGEAFVTVYPDSDKIGAAPGVVFRRADAVEVWADSSTDHSSRDGRGRSIELDAQTGAATRFELSQGDATGPYHYAWCREEWVLVLAGSPTLRHSHGEDELRAGDVVCFPEGPTGARQLRNDGEHTAQLIAFSTPTDRPMSAFYPDAGTVAVRISDREGFFFRLDDQIDDYWDGEPGASTA
jgi:uncharacterized cupin superfamily protein